MASLQETFLGQQSSQTAGFPTPEAKKTTDPEQLALALAGMASNPQIAAFFRLGTGDTSATGTGTSAATGFPGGGSSYLPAGTSAGTSLTSGLQSALSGYDLGTSALSAGSKLGALYDLITSGVTPTLANISWLLGGAGSAPAGWAADVLSQGGQPSQAVLDWLATNPFGIPAASTAPALSAVAPEAMPAYEALVASGFPPAEAALSAVAPEATALSAVAPEATAAGEEALSGILASGAGEAGAAGAGGLMAALEPALGAMAFLAPAALGITAALTQPSIAELQDQAVGVAVPLLNKWGTVAAAWNNFKATGDQSAARDYVVMLDLKNQGFITSGGGLSSGGDLYAPITTATGESVGAGGYLEGLARYYGYGDQARGQQVIYDAIKSFDHAPTIQEIVQKATPALEALRTSILAYQDYGSR